MREIRQLSPFILPSVFVTATAYGDGNATDLSGFCLVETRKKQP
jgi:hypothetical protein